MKIYIPPHLRNIEIFNQMSRIIQEYSTNYYLDDRNSFDDYYYSLSNDPVKKFLNLNIAENSIPEGETLEDVLNYLTKLFYSVKGTVKVFEYMIKYLPLTFSSILYTPKYVDIKIENLTVNDESLFYQIFQEFLNALLYFQNLTFETKKSTLILEEEIDNWTDSDIIVFKKYTAELYEDDN